MTFAFGVTRGKNQDLPYFVTNGLYLDGKDFLAVQGPYSLILDTTSPLIAITPYTNMYRIPDPISCFSEYCVDSSGPFSKECKDDQCRTTLDFADDILYNISLLESKFSFCYETLRRDCMQGVSLGIITQSNSDVFKFKSNEKNFGFLGLSPSSDLLKSNPFVSLFPRKSSIVFGDSEDFEARNRIWNKADVSSPGWKIDAQRVIFHGFLISSSTSIEIASAQWNSFLSKRMFLEMRSIFVDSNLGPRKKLMNDASVICYQGKKSALEFSRFSELQLELENNFGLSVQAEDLFEEIEDTTCSIFYIFPEDVAFDRIILGGSFLNVLSEPLLLDGATKRVSMATRTKMMPKSEGLIVNMIPEVATSGSGNDGGVIGFTEGILGGKIDISKVRGFSDGFVKSFLGFLMICFLPFYCLRWRMIKREKVEKLAQKKNKYKSLQLKEMEEDEPLNDAMYEIGGDSNSDYSDSEKQLQLD